MRVGGGEGSPHPYAAELHVYARMSPQLCDLLSCLGVLAYCGAHGGGGFDPQCELHGVALVR